MEGTTNRSYDPVRHMSLRSQETLHFGLWTWILYILSQELFQVWNSRRELRNSLLSRSPRWKMRPSHQSKNHQTICIEEDMAEAREVEKARWIGRERCRMPLLWPHWTSRKEKVHESFRYDWSFCLLRTRRCRLCRVEESNIHTCSNCNNRYHFHISIQYDTLIAFMYSGLQWTFFHSAILQKHDIPLKLVLMFEENASRSRIHLNNFSQILKNGDPQGFCTLTCPPLDLFLKTNLFSSLPLFFSQLSKQYFLVVQ